MTSRAATARLGSIGWLSWPGRPTAIAISEAASAIGMAKPRPWASVETAVLMPMTLPVWSRSGPPLLPGLIAASVWSRPVSVTGRPVVSSWTVIVRPVADRMPLVTVSVNVPSGLPIAMVVSPTWSVPESPMVAGLRPVASTLISARSLSSDSLTILAVSWRPSESSTVSESLPVTTCLLVRM